MGQIKQVIVVRHDLNMRKGKYAAQASHASMAFLSNKIREMFGTFDQPYFNEAEVEWLTGSFAKVVCKVSSEEELMEIYQKAQAAGLQVNLITDSGRTEFHGVPTRTCLAVGPDTAERIDPVTGHLGLA